MCQYPTRSLLASRSADVLGGAGEGIFIEIVLRDTDPAAVVREQNTVMSAVNTAAAGGAPLYDPGPNSEYIALEPRPYGDGSYISKIQGGPSSTEWQAERAEDWVGPEGEPDTDAVLPWWTWVAVSAVGTFALAGVVSLLAIKRPKQDGKGAVTVSDFYRTMPASYQAPIPEEHYCIDNDVASSVELDSNRDSFSGLGFVHPVGRI